jgi:hypothetical protein
VAPGWYKATAKIAYKANGNDLVGWDTLKNISDDDAANDRAAYVEAATAS